MADFRRPRGRGLIFETHGVVLDQGIVEQDAAVGIAAACLKLPDGSYLARTIKLVQRPHGIQLTDLRLSLHAIFMALKWAARMQDEQNVHPIHMLIKSTNRDAVVLIEHNNDEWLRNGFLWDHDNIICDKSLLYLSLHSQEQIEVQGDGTVFFHEVEATETPRALRACQNRLGRNF